MAVTLSLWACSDEPASRGDVGGSARSGDGEAVGRAAGEDRGGPRPFDPSVAGTVAGFVRADGDQPEQVLVEMTEAHCRGVHPAGGVLDERILVGPGRGLANVFVWIESGLDGWTFPPADGEVVLDQVGCLYEPRIFGMRTGQDVSVRSSDPVLHNVHFKPNANRERNIAMPAGAPPLSVSFRRPEVMVEVKCDVHAWMTGWIGVLDHPCFAVTGADGAFRIASVPPGHYTLGVWHEQLGHKQVTIDVAANAEVVTDDIVMEL